VGSRLATLTAQLIDANAASLGTPRFVPHVTLLGGFHAESDAAAQRQLHALAAQLQAPASRPVCRCATVEAGELYYQCVYVLMELDEGLCAAHEAARLAFSAPATPGERYMPHLSLLYGEVSGEAKAQAVLAARGALAALASDEAEFWPSALSLWKTRAGETETWTQIEDVEF